MSRALAVLLVVLCSNVAWAVATAGRYDNQAIRVDRDTHPAATTRPATTQPARATVANPPGSAPASLTASQLDWPRVLISLGAVVGLIILMRVAMKKWLGAVGTSGAGRSVRVLGRTVLGPRQQVVLLQIGRRIVVTADNGGQLSTLAQITEPDEVAALLGASDSRAAEEPEPGRGGFGRLFGAARQPFVASEVDADPEDEAQLAAATAGGEGASVDAARGELAGLMDKIRGLSRQFRRPS